MSPPAVQWARRPPPLPLPLPLPLLVAAAVCALLWLSCSPSPLPLILVAAGQSVCALVDPLPLVNHTTGAATSCVESVGVAPSAACSVQCLSGAILVGGAEFRCAHTAFWLSQSQCDEWTPPVVAGPGGPFEGTLLAVLSRPAAAAASQRQRHAAANRLSNISGWELLALRELDGAVSLMVSVDGLSWVARSVQTADVATAASWSLPAVTITESGRLVSLPAIVDGRGYYYSDEALQQWVLVGTPPDTAYSGAREGAAVASVPGDPSTIVWGGGAIRVSGTSEFTNDVWRFSSSDVDITGHFERMTNAAPWSMRRDASFVFLAAKVADPDPSPTAPSPPSVPTLLCLGGRNGATLFRDVWSSVDFGATWTAVGTAPFSFGGGVSLAGVVWSLRQITSMTTGGVVYGHQLWQSVDARSWTRVVNTDWRPPVPGSDGQQLPFFPVQHRRDLVVFRGEPASGPIVSGSMSRTVLAQATMSSLRAWEAWTAEGETEEVQTELVFSPPFDWSTTAYSVWSPRARPEPSAPMPRLLWAAERDFGNVTVVCAIDGRTDGTMAQVRVALPEGGLPSAPLLCTGLHALATELTVTVVAADSAFVVRVLRAPLLSLTLPASSRRNGQPFTLAPDFHWTNLDYEMVVMAGRSWPTEVVLQLGIAFGLVNVSTTIVDSTEAPQPVGSFGSQADSVDVTVPLPARGTGGASPTAPILILIDTLAGTYTVTLHNPCGFDLADRFSPGTRCPPQSVCFPLNTEEWECSPGIAPQSLQIWQIGTAANQSTLLPSTLFPGDGAADPARVEVGLPPLSESSASQRLRVGFRVAPTDDFRFELRAVTFAAEGLSVETTAAYGSGNCTNLGALSAPINGEQPYQCWLDSRTIGLRMHLQLRVCSKVTLDSAGGSLCWVQSSADSFSSPPPFFPNRTAAAASAQSLERLAPTADRVGPAGDLVAQGMHETLAMGVGNFVPDAAAARVAYGSTVTLALFYAAAASGALSIQAFDALVASSGAAPCSLLLGQGESSFSRLVCTTPSGASFSGQRLRFIVFVAGQLTPTPSEDSYSYPVRPQIDRVAGCSDVGNSTMDCPTRGGLRITLSGAGFSLSDLSISVAGMGCMGVEVVVPEKVVSCLLPAGTGNSVSVTVSSFGILSISLPMLSYAKPNITAVACDACESSSVDGSSGAVRLEQCARTASQSGGGGSLQRPRVLHLSGRDFGSAGSTVMVGSVICSREAASVHLNASEELPPDTDASVRCFLPEGKSVTQPVLLIQNNGKISESAHSVSYSPCPAGSFDPAPADSGALECELCSEGKFSALAGSAVCSPCAAGSVADARGSLGCAPCPPRTFQAKEGGSQCEPCPSGAYAPTAGSSTCSHCPAGLYLGSSSPNASSADCLPCPEGGQCFGQMITSAPDFYLRLTRDGGVRAFQCPSGYCSACDMVALAQRNATSTAPMSTDGASDGNATVVPLATVVTCCAANRDPASALCGRCAPGFEDWSGTCKPCARSNSGLVVAFIVLSTLLVAWLAHSASNASVGLTAIGLYFVQTASLEFGSAAVLVAWLQAINFNPDFFTSDSSCVVQLNAYGQVVLSILMPLLLLAELALIAALHGLVHRWVGAASAPLAPLPPAPRPPPPPSHHTGHSMSGSDFVKESAALPTGGHATVSSLPSSRARTARASLAVQSRALVQQWSIGFTLPYYSNAVIAVLQFSYTGVSSAAIKFLWCVDVGDERVVFAQPGMRCDSADYRRVLPLVVVAIVGFVVAFPVAVALGGWMRHRRLTSGRKSVVAAAESGALLTPLYGVFRPGAWYWSSFVLLRRSVFVVLDVVLASAPRYRAFAFGLANQVSYFCSLYAAPFPDKILNRLESASQMALLLISALLTVQLPPYSDAMNAVLLLVLLATVLALIAGACMQQRRKRRHVASFPSGSARSHSAEQSHDVAAAAAHASPFAHMQHQPAAELTTMAPSALDHQSDAAATAAALSSPSAPHDSVREAAIDVELMDANGDSAALSLGHARSDDEVAL